MTDTTRRTSIGAQRSPATETAILDAAARLLEERGLAGFSIEAVAREARAGKPTIYKWWGSKVGLLLDLYQRNKPADIHPDTGTVRSDVAAYLVNLMDHWEGSPSGAMFRSIIAEAQQDTAARVALEAYFADHYDATAAMLARGLPFGEVNPDADLHQAAEHLGALAVQRLLSGRGISVKEAGMAADMILSGIGPQANGSAG